MWEILRFCFRCVYPGYSLRLTCRRRRSQLAAWILPLSNKRPFTYFTFSHNHNVFTYSMHETWFEFPFLVCSCRRLLGRRRSVSEMCHHRMSTTSNNIEIRTTCEHVSISSRRLWHSSRHNPTWSLLESSLVYSTLELVTICWLVCNPFSDHNQSACDFFAFVEDGNDNDDNQNLISIYVSARHLMDHYYRQLLPPLLLYSDPSWFLQGCNWNTSCHHRRLPTTSRLLCTVHTLVVANGQLTSKQSEPSPHISNVDLRTPSAPLSSHTNPIWNFWQSAFFLFEIFNRNTWRWLLAPGGGALSSPPSDHLPIMLTNAFQLIHCPQIEIGFEIYDNWIQNM